MKKKPTYILDIVVFVCGAVVMILELTGTRILAPFVGGSLPVWTGLIGIILGSLSLGYIWGGKLADKKPETSALSSILLLTSASLVIIPLFSKFLLPFITINVQDERITAVLAALSLFAIPSLLLGMVSPYAIRLKLNSVSTSGVTAGRLSALSTIGSITGTFLAGFFLIAYFGSTTIVYALAITVFVLACILAGKDINIKVLIITLIFGVVGIGGLFMTFSSVLLDADTMYNRVLLLNTKDQHTQRPIREMLIGNERSSAMFLDGDDLVYDYTKYYTLADHFVPNLHNTLMIGGAGYSYPKYFLKNTPQGKMTVIEIDPALTTIAQKYFALPTDKRLTIYHEDARTFLNREEQQYDAIFNDAFSSHYSHPFQLSTKEAIEHMARILKPDGVIITNAISSLSGNRGKFFRAEYLTYKSVFPYVYVFPVSYRDKEEDVQNIMIIAAKKQLNLESKDNKYKQYLANQWTKKISEDVPILTDDYAPVERYAADMFD